MKIRGMRFVGDVKRFFLLPNYRVRGIALKDFFLRFPERRFSFFGKRIQFTVIFVLIF